MGLTSVIVTHNVEQMKKLVDYCYILAAAKLIAQGTPQELMHSDDPAVDQFMNGKVEGPISFRYLPGETDAGASQTGS